MVTKEISFINLNRKYPNYIWVIKGPHICGLNIKDNTWICIVDGKKPAEMHLNCFMWHVIKYDMPCDKQDNARYLSNKMAMFNDSYIISEEYVDLS